MSTIKELIDAIENGDDAPLRRLTIEAILKINKFLSNEKSHLRKELNSGSNSRTELYNMIFDSLNDVTVQNSVLYRDNSYHVLEYVKKCKSYKKSHKSKKN